MDQFHAAGITSSLWFRRKLANMDLCTLTEQSRHLPPSWAVHKIGEKISLRPSPAPRLYFSEDHQDHREAAKGWMVRDLVGFSPFWNRCGTSVVLSMCGEPSPSV
jgi:hypothetical protein